MVEVQAAARTVRLDRRDGAARARAPPCFGASARCTAWKIASNASDASAISCSLNSAPFPDVSTASALRSVVGATIPVAPLELSASSAAKTSHKDAATATSGSRVAPKVSGSSSCTAPLNRGRCHSDWMTTLRKQLYSPSRFTNPAAGPWPWPSFAPAPASPTTSGASAARVSPPSLGFDAFGRFVSTIDAASAALRSSTAKPLASTGGGAAIAGSVGHSASSAGATGDSPPLDAADLPALAAAAAATAAAAAAAAGPPCAATVARTGTPAARGPGPGPGGGGGLAPFSGTPTTTPSRAPAESCAAYAT